MNVHVVPRTLQVKPACGFRTRREAVSFPFDRANIEGYSAARLWHVEDVSHVGTDVPSWPEMQTALSKISMIATKIIFSHLSDAPNDDQEPQGDFVSTLVARENERRVHNCEAAIFFLIALAPLRECAKAF
jgi:hypothetical protein